MSTDASPSRRGRSAEPGAATMAETSTRRRFRASPGPSAVLDAVLLVAFLALVFLLGAFPLKDTDFWWHLRTGDLIRQRGDIPKVDEYTFGAAGQRWTDLHWIFQLLVSWGHEAGGVAALTLGKCAVTTASLLILITARRRDWPLWAMVLGWMPALFVLSGRMYVRPETLTLLFLSIDLAILTRIERNPRLAYGLPIVQLFWVNSHGLFVLGPILFALALVDAALMAGSFAKSRQAWWRIVLGAAAMTGGACLFNPYGLSGALYPLQLFFGTMRNPIFQSIAELEPIGHFISRDGLRSLPLRVHLATMVLGALSFIAPLCWLTWARIRDARKEAAGRREEQPTRPSKKALPAPAKAKAKSKTKPVVKTWRLSPFRVMLFLTFSFLGLQASRNSHQFAAVVGAVTAWNLAEWAAAVSRRSAKSQAPRSIRPGPRLAALAVVAAAIGLVGSGQVYAWAGEGRTVGLGEEPLWYPHDAIRYAGGPGMPDRFLAFHIGHPSLYEYYHAPEKKVFVDARLEVIGPDLYERYMALQSEMEQDRPGWDRQLDAMGRPTVLFDHEHTFQGGASLLAHPRWRPIWFDPIAIVFAHESSAPSAPTVDFGARHFHPDPATTPSGVPALLASARGLFRYASILASKERGIVARPLILLGLDHARRASRAVPDSADGFKLMAELEMLRPRGASTLSRYRPDFEPVSDLTTARVIYLFNEALRRAPENFASLASLFGVYQAQRMSESAIPLIEKMLAVRSKNAMQQGIQASLPEARFKLQSELGPNAPTEWDNRDDLDRLLTGLLGHGRVASAADLLERAYRPESRPWGRIDELATLRLHLGQPDRARAIWLSAASPPRPPLRTARVAATHYVEGDLEAARAGYREALAGEPALFEAAYGLAMVELDSGRANEAVDAARLALSLAPDDPSRLAARAILETSQPHADAKRRIE